MKIEEEIKKLENKLFRQLARDFSHPELGEDEIIRNSMAIIYPFLELFQKEQNKLIKENKRQKAKLLSAQVFDYDDLSDQAKKDFLIKNGK